MCIYRYLPQLTSNSVFNSCINRSISRCNIDTSHWYKEIRVSDRIIARHPDAKYIFAGYTNISLALQLA